MNSVLALRAAGLKKETRTAAVISFQEGFTSGNTAWIDQTDVYDLQTYILAGRRRPLKHAVDKDVAVCTTAFELQTSRDAFWRETQSLPAYRRHKLRYAWQTASVLDKRWTMEMEHFAAMVVLPSLKHKTFQPHPVCPEGIDAARRRSIYQHTGVALADLDTTVAVTLSRRSCRLSTQSNWSQQWRLDGFGLWLDDRGNLRAGGCDPYGYNHHRYWSYFSTPDDRYFNGRFLALCEEGVDMLHTIEMASLNGIHVQTVWSWPRVWLGFGRDQDTPFDFTESQKHDTLRDLHNYLSLRDAGERDDDNPFFAMANLDAWRERLGSMTGRYDVDRLVEELGPETVLEMVSLRCQICETSFAGLVWYPLDYFERNSLADLNKYAQVLSFPHELTERGGVHRGAIQVVALPRRGSTVERLAARLKDTTPGVIFDLMGKAY